MENSKENIPLNLIAEVYILVHWRGQVRFRVYVNDGIFMYTMSDREFDNKINSVTARPISRNCTTHELEYFWENDLLRRKLLLKTFEELVKGIENPLQYINQMFKKEIEIDTDVVEFYIFPIKHYRDIKK